MNPRKNSSVSDPKFAELVESIKQKGVIEPIIVRPIALNIHDKGRKRAGLAPQHAQYEIVAGERRYKASIEAGLQAIPAIVRELSDDEAYDFMLIENLQRQDLTEREEAESFKAYVKLHKSSGLNAEDSIPMLAEKTGIRPTYIRARIRVLELPAKVMKAWDDGTLVFGHLQQLLRLPDKEALEEMVKWLFQQIQWERAVTVKDLARHIDDEAPAIGGAFFKASESCRICPSNSAVQKELFGVETKSARCLNPACFKKRQAEWIEKNWKITATAKRCGTSGARFSEDLDYGDFNHFGWSGKSGLKCATCESFVSIIELSGKVSDEQACVGDKGCYHAVTNPKSAKEKATGERDPEAPRASWHGEYFRDVFLSKRIPEELAKLAAGDPKVQDLLLACAVHGNRFELDHPREHDYSGWVLRTPADEKARVLKKIIEKVILSGQHVGPSSYNGFGTKGRHLVGAFLGIDLAKEYAVDQEYLEKKTKADILAFGKKFKLFDKNVDATKLKKTELVKVILAHGPKLVGLVPAEILKEGKS